MSASTQASIDARYNGPPQSGNGGYSCGRVAAYIDGPARVRLHAPPPLDTPMTVLPDDDGSVTLFDGDAKVATGVPALLQMSVPPAPSLAQARAAQADYPGLSGHAFPTCFVCGPGRPHHDGLELFAGPVRGSDQFACSWQPAADLAAEDGSVRDEIVWAALDCPGYFAAMGDNLRPALLGELTADLRAPVPAGVPLVVFAWPLGQEGRKHFAGTAVADESGEVLACAHSVWIELQS